MTAHLHPRIERLARSMVELEKRDPQWAGAIADLAEQWYAYFLREKARAEAQQ